MVYCINQVKRTWNVLFTEQEKQLMAASCISLSRQNRCIQFIDIKTKERLEPGHHLIENGRDWSCVITCTFAGFPSYRMDEIVTKAIEDVKK
jgi:hypothetical protein